MGHVSVLLGIWRLLGDWVRSLSPRSLGISAPIWKTGSVGCKRQLIHIAERKIRMPKMFPKLRSLNWISYKGGMPFGFELSLGRNM